MYTKDALGVDRFVRGRRLCGSYRNSTNKDHWMTEIEGLSVAFEIVELERIPERRSVAVLGFEGEVKDRG